MNEIAIYDGDELICMGPLHVVAQKLGVRIGTIRFYLTPAYARRVAKSKNPEGRRMAVRI